MSKLRKTMATKKQTPNQNLKTLGLFLIPIVLLAGVIALFLSTGGGA